MSLSLYILGFLVLLQLEVAPFAHGTSAVTAVSTMLGKQSEQESRDTVMQVIEQIFPIPIIYSGNIIALQTTTRYLWTSCAGGVCDTRVCPRTYMNGADYTNCWGEVFKIYRRSGPGAVKVGDYVGIYYPREGNWFGCAGAKCGKAACPGHPTMAHGFQNEEKWHHCWGEVFKIYAQGKAVGSTISHKDDIMLYYLREGNWVSHFGGTLHKNPCPGTHRPPPFAKYDFCYGEVFGIWKKGLPI